MREVGLLVWVVIMVAGVVSSIVQSARKRAAMNAATGTPAPASAQRLAEMRRLAQSVAVRVDSSGNVVSLARPVATAPRPPGQPRPPAPAAAPSGKPAAAAPASPAPSQQAPAWPVGPVERPAHRALQRLFRDRHALADAVVASEVIGKPLALRNE